MSRAAPTILLLLASLAAAGAEESYLHRTLSSSVVVADRDAASDRIEAWVERQGGYVLLVSGDLLTARLPNGALPAFRELLQSLAADVVDTAMGATDLRDAYVAAEAALRSREEILARSLSYLARADVAGTLAIEKEVTSLMQEIEGYKGKLRKIEVDRRMAGVDVHMAFVQKSLPQSLPSSFGWIDGVDFFAFVRRPTTPAGGGRVRMQTPEGFAPMEGRGSYVAVSPEGVRIEARWVGNDPRKDLSFWIDALSYQLRNRGYAPSGAAESFKAGNQEGRMLEWLLPYGAEAWTYMTAIVVSGRRILVIEATGERGLYDRYRAAVLTALAGSSL
jgi:hypothetical protein